MDKRQIKIWCVFLSILFFSLFLLPIIFLKIQEARFIKSDHLTLNWGQNSEELAISPKQIIGQTFIASQNNLARIGIRMHRGGRDSKASYVFTLKDGPESLNILRQGQFSLGKIFRTAYFEFAPISNSAGKLFYFSIEPTAGTATPVGVFKSITDLEGGDLYVNNQKQIGDIVFQIYSANPINFKTFLRILLSRMSQYKPSFLKMPYLYVYWLFFIGSIVYLIYFLLQQFILTDNQLFFKTKITALFSLWLMIGLLFLWIQTQVPVFYL